MIKRKVLMWLGVVAIALMGVVVAARPVEAKACYNKDTGTHTHDVAGYEWCPDGTTEYTYWCENVVSGAKTKSVSQNGKCNGTDEKKSTDPNFVDPNYPKGAANNGNGGTNNGGTNNGGNGVTVIQGGICQDSDLIGFKAWYAGLNCDPATSSVIAPNKGDTAAMTRFVWQIALNVLYDLFLAVGYIALAMVLYAGYLYIMSQGDVNRVAKAKKAMTSAVLGVVLAMSATVLVNTILTVLGVRNGPLAADSSASATSNLIQSAFNWAYGMGGLVAVVFIIKNGFDYMVSTGSPDKTTKATKGIIFSLAGLAVVVMASLITSFIINAVGGSLQ